MRANLPSLDARVSHEEASRLKREVIIETLNTKGAWLDHHLKKLLPPEIYAMAHDYSAPYQAFENRQAMVRDFMKKHDYRLEEHGLNCRLFKGKTLISQFFVKLADE